MNNTSETIVKAKKLIGWDEALWAARFTTGISNLEVHEPSDEWKRKILLAEHSPIRCVTYRIECYNVPAWVCTHLVRHHIGVEKFVATQRTDRNPDLLGKNRNELSQGLPTNIAFILNAQSLINISRQRLCNKASKETRELWQAVKEAIKEIDPIMAEAMVPNCIYRGKCPEMQPCFEKNGNKQKR